MTVRELALFLESLPQDAYIVIARGTSGFLDVENVVQTSWDEIQLAGRDKFGKEYIQE